MPSEYARSQETNSLPREVLERVALATRLVERVVQMNRVRERVPPHLAPERYLRESQQRYLLPARRAAPPVVQARANSLPIEAREALYRNARILREMGAFPQSGDLKAPTAKGAKNSHLPTSAWNDEEEETTDLRVMRYQNPVRSQAEDDQGEQEEIARAYLVLHARGII